MVALETRSVIDALRSEMQGRILKGTIPAGTALAEETVAEMFDVARPTAKAAIEQLVGVGLLRRMRNKSARVPILSADDVADLYLSRAIVESAAARILAEQGKVPSNAAFALERFRSAMARGDSITDLVEGDIGFHRALVAATGSPRLRRLHDLVIGEAHLCMAQVQVHRLLDNQLVIEEHSRILAMIDAGDIDRAGSEMNAHVSRARNQLLAYLRRNENEAASTLAHDV
jgi:DNA-binding GntR family transcriptional regulator